MGMKMTELARANGSERFYILINLDGSTRTYRCYVHLNDSVKTIADSMAESFGIPREKIGLTKVFQQIELTQEEDTRCV